MLIVNATTYFLNITRANLEDKATWELHHNILEAYELEDMSPQTLYGFAERVLQDEKTAVKFLNWQEKGGRDATTSSCDGNCRRGTYCDLVTSYAEDETLCHTGQNAGAIRRKDPHMKGFVNHY